MSSRILFALSLAAVAACSADDPDPDPATDAGIAVDAALSVDARVIDAPVGTTCAVKEPIVQVGFTCRFQWRQCTGSSDRTLDCRIQNVAGHVFSLCDCIVGGGSTMQFVSTTVCDAATWSELEATVNAQCGWNLL
jgi:hypothetical protein